MFKRSQTESPGMHGSDWTQLSVGSQYDIAGQSESLILCRHFPLFASHKSSVHETPSLQFAGNPVAMQKPLRHSTPLFPSQRFPGGTQSSLWTQALPMFPPPPPPSPASSSGSVPLPAFAHATTPHVHQSKPTQRDIGSAPTIGR